MSGINLALQALADPNSACSKLFNPNLMKDSPDKFLTTLMNEGNIGFANRIDQLRDILGPGPAFDGVTSGEDLLNPASPKFENGVLQRHPNSIPSNRTYTGATSVMSGNLSTQRTAFVLIHELAHMADRIFGADASSLVPDVGKSKSDTKDLQKKNDEKMEDCKKYLKTLK